MGRKRDMQIADMVGKPISEKIDKVEEAIRRDGNQTREEYKEQISNLKNVVDVVLDDLSSREKKELYDLNTIIDISSLEETERRFLVEALYTLAGMTEEVVDSQQVFIRSVQKYLGIKNVQTMVDLSSVENIENIPTQKALMQTIMEFLFLENNDHSYIVEYEDVFSYFSVNKKGIHEIQKAISNIYMAVGNQGLSEKYGFVVEPDLNETLCENIDIAEVKKILTSWRNQELESYEALFTAYFLASDLYFSKDIDYWEEDIKSMSACKSKAEEVLESLYNGCVSLMSPYSSSSVYFTVAKSFYEDFESDITKLQHHFRNLREMGGNEDKMSMIESLLESSKLQNSIQEVLREEIQDSYYRLDDFTKYSKLIEYDEWGRTEMCDIGQTGIEKLVDIVFTFVDNAINIYYRYSCSKAWRKIETDINKKAKHYDKSGALAVKKVLIKKHIEPAEFLIDEIRIALEK